MNMLQSFRSIFISACFMQVFQAFKLPFSFPLLLRQREPYHGQWEALCS